MNLKAQSIPRATEARDIKARAVIAFLWTFRAATWPDERLSKLILDDRGLLHVVLRARNGKELARYRVRKEGKLMVVPPKR